MDPLYLGDFLILYYYLTLADKFLIPTLACDVHDIENTILALYACSCVMVLNIGQPSSLFNNVFTLFLPG